MASGVIFAGGLSSGSTLSAGCDGRGGLVRRYLPRTMRGRGRGKGRAAERMVALRAGRGARWARRLEDAEGLAGGAQALLYLQRLACSAGAGTGCSADASRDARRACVRCGAARRGNQCLQSPRKRTWPHTAAWPAACLCHPTSPGRLRRAQRKREYYNIIFETD